jgi:hypothetical protein
MPTITVSRNSRFFFLVSRIGDGYAIWRLSTASNMVDIAEGREATHLHV